MTSWTPMRVAAACVIVNRFAGASVLWRSGGDYTSSIRSAAVAASYGSTVVATSPPSRPTHIIRHTSAVLLAAGARLGAYEVLSLIGAGGMGEVYRARDVRLGRTVALKVLSPGLANDETARHRLLREARAVSSIDHPNICALYDVGQGNGIDYL